MMNKEDIRKVVEIIDRKIQIAKEWRLDAEARSDWNDVSYYHGQEKVLLDLKSWILQKINF